MNSLGKKTLTLVTATSFIAASLGLALPAQAKETTQVSCTTSQGSTLRASHEWDTTKTGTKGYENTFTANANSGAQSVTVVSGHKVSKPPKTWNPTKTVTVYAKKNKTKVTVTLHKSLQERCDAFVFTYTQALPTPPGAPTKLVAKPGDGEVKLSWSPPDSAGGEKITGYTVYSSSTSASGPWGIVSGPSTKTSATIAGLINGQTYWFRVTATNAVGEGTGAVTESVMPTGPPSAPQGLTATPGDKSVALAWSLPANNGGSPITEYTVYRSSTSASGPWSKVGDTSDTFRTVSSLKNGTTYWFKVTASNKVGEGEEGIVSDPVIPAAKPGAPRSAKAQAGNSSITVTWSPPTSDGGAPIVGYSVYYSRGSSSGPWTLFVSGLTTTNATVTGLANGTPYWVKVTASNRTGEGDGDTDGPVTPFTVPDAVRDLAATVGDRKVSLVWSIPTFDGGSAIKDYIIQYRTTSGTGAWQAYSDGTSSRTTATVSGLSNGVAYDFQVAPVNAAGTGSFTAISNITPLGEFEEPKVTDAQIMQRDSEQATVTFELGDMGGRQMSGVEYSVDGGTSWQSPVSFTPSTLVTQAMPVTLNGYSYLVRIVASNGDRSPASKAVSKPTSRPSLDIEAAKKAYESEGSTALEISWRSTSRATYYKLYPMVGNPAQLPWNFDSETLKMKHSGLAWNTEYGYIIAACNAGGCSTYSSEEKGLTNPRPAAWRVRDAGGSKLEVVVPDMPAGALSYRIKYCDATSSPGCDPDVKASFNRFYSAAGTQSIAVKTKRSYNVVVVYFTKTKGTGSQTVTITKNISVTSAK